MVVDANILFAALIKDGVIANILFNTATTLYAPTECILEIQKYESLLKKKLVETISSTLFLNS